MKLDNKIKELIEVEYNSFKEYMYANSPKEIRDELGQFFTPAGATIMMLEKLEDDWTDGNILDPTSGSGNLLAACFIAGADADKIFGNEYDARMVEACRNRIKTIPDRLDKYDHEFAESLRAKLVNFNDWQIHQGNALQRRCLVEFGPEYSGKQDSNGHLLPHYNPEYIDDLEYAQGTNCWRIENEQAKVRNTKQNFEQMSLFDFWSTKKKGKKK